jgi:uncharacterized protein (TIGR01777 family)
MRIAVTGASGLIGTRLVTVLREEGHDVLRLVRRTAAAPDEVRWAPDTGQIDTAGLEGIDGAVHLAGAGIGDRRWTAAYKREIRASRIQGTSTLATAMATLEQRPRVLVSGSAIGYYGDTGDAVVDENSPRGDGFLAKVVGEWEGSAEPARRAGIRVVHPRTGLVLSGRGGTWGRLFPLFKAGLGGRIGDGRQYWSFVSLEDEVRALVHMLTDTTLSGPVNVTAPNPVTNAEMTEAMGRALHRPTKLAVPGFALRIALGEFAGDVLTGQRVMPRCLLDAGFTFHHPTADDALAAALAER